MKAAASPNQSRDTIAPAEDAITTGTKARDA
jgi:hypothetical protein